VFDSQSIGLLPQQALAITHEFFASKPTLVFDGCSCSSDAPSDALFLSMASEIACNGGRFENGKLHHRCKGEARLVETYYQISASPRILIIAGGVQMYDESLSPSPALTITGRFGENYFLLGGVFQVSHNHYRALVRLPGGWHWYDSLWQQLWARRTGDHGSYPTMLPPASWLLYEK
jgi:hypothetical protein